MYVLPSMCFGPPLQAEGSEHPHWSESFPFGLVNGSGFFQSCRRHAVSWIQSQWEARGRAAGSSVGQIVPLCDSVGEGLNALSEMLPGLKCECYASWILMPSFIWAALPSPAICVCVCVCVCARLFFLPPCMRNRLAVMDVGVPFRDRLIYRFTNIFPRYLSILP